MKIRVCVLLDFRRQDFLYIVQFLMYFVEILRFQNWYTVSRSRVIDRNKVQSKFQVLQAPNNHIKSCQKSSQRRVYTLATVQNSSLTLLTHNNSDKDYYNKTAMHLAIFGQSLSVATLFIRLKSCSWLSDFI